MAFGDEVAGMIKAAFQDGLSWLLTGAISAVAVTKAAKKVREDKTDMDADSATSEVIALLRSEVARLHEQVASLNSTIEELRAEVTKWHLEYNRLAMLLDARGIHDGSQTHPSID